MNTFEFVTNSATITDADNVIDVNALNDSDSVSVQARPTTADLSLTNTVNNDTPTIGDNVAFTITVRNDGPDDAPGVAATAMLPSEFSFVSSAPSVGFYDAASGLWTIGALMNGDEVTMTLIAVAQKIGAVRLDAEITAADANDPDSTPDNGIDDEDDFEAVLLDVRPLNIAPTVTLEADTYGPFVAPHTLLIRGTITDPDSPLPDVVGVDLGDGSVREVQVQSDGSFSLEHTYTEVGTFTITARAVDDQGAVGEDTSIVTIAERLFDFGDAPARYPVTRDQSGASHVATGATLGLLRDVEDDGQPSDDGTGDDLNPMDRPDDEDGLVRHLITSACGSALVVNVQGVTRVVHLNAWVDFNADGDWSDAGEQVAVDQRVTENGEQVIAFVTPAGSVTGATYARVRLSSETGLFPTAAAMDGEVEDHLVVITDAAPIVYVDDDYAGLSFGSDPDGAGPAIAFGVDAFSTIQEGIECVQVGGVVQVAEGSYPENVVIPKTLTLDGAGPMTVVSPAGGQGTGVVIGANSVTVSELRVTGAMDGLSAENVDSPKLLRIQSDGHRRNGFLANNIGDELLIEGGNYTRNNRQGIHLSEIKVTLTMRAACFLAADCSSRMWTNSLSTTLPLTVTRSAICW